MEDTDQDKLQQEMYNLIYDAWECIYQSNADLTEFFMKRALADLTEAMKLHESSELVNRRKLAARNCIICGGE